MGNPPLYTIGYGAREIDAFIDVLRAYEIVYLIDIRSRPYSRYKPDFSKEALAGHLEEAGIRYVFMGDTLGGSRMIRRATRTARSTMKKCASSPSSNVA
jgi:uncharacterized protein (DUF488 family)